MSIRMIKDIEINSVTLDSTDKKESGTKSTMSVFSSFRLTPKSKSSGHLSFSNVRMRVVASYGKHSSEVMDFITQRIQEYKGLQKQDGKFSAKVPAPQFISFMKGDFSTKSADKSCEDFYDFLEESQPLSPYSSKMAAVQLMFKNQFVYNGDGINLPPSMAMFDAPISDLLGTEVSKLVNKGDYDSLSEILIHLDPIHFKFKETDLKNTKQLSLYAYMYTLSDSDIGVSQISLSTGMTNPVSKTLIGNKTIWKSISLDNPMIGIGNKPKKGTFSKTTTTSSPDKQKLTIFNSNNNAWALFSSIAQIEKNLTSPPASAKITRREGIRKIVKKGNYFSNFWLTKDSQENHRFSFAFDLESYLAEHSLFPYLYRNRDTSVQILDGTGLMDTQSPSYIMNMTAKRIFIDPPSNLPINNLGTNGYSTELGPNSDFPQKIIMNVSRLDDIAIPNIDSSIGQTIAKNKISFFEGKDILNEGLDPNARHDGSFRYGVDYTIYDASPIFIRESLKRLILVRNILDDLHYKLTNTPLRPTAEHATFVDVQNIFDHNTGYLTSKASEIRTYNKHAGKSWSVEEYLSYAMIEYKGIIQNFADKVDTLPLDYFADRFSAEYLRVSYIQEFIEHMNIFIHMLYRRLSEVFPTNPLGRDISSLERNNFESRGVSEFKMPLMRGSHYFDKKVIVGKDYGFGIDYLIKTENDSSDRNGLSRILISEYGIRIGAEIGKYFKTAGSAEPAQAAAAYGSLAPVLGESAYKFFTPLIIRVPNRKDIIQTAEVQGSVYPLSEYAQMFVDVFRHKSLIHPGGLHDPLILDNDQKLSANGRLYDCVVGLLQEQHESSINDSPTIQYPSLDSITTAKDISTSLDVPRHNYLPILDGPLAIPSIIGGKRDLGSADKAYFNAVDSSLASIYAINKGGYKDEKQSELKEVQRPIKFPFAIFGELSIDPELRLAVTYQEKMINSLKNLSSALSLSHENIGSFLSSPSASEIPSSIKSMLVLASTSDQNPIINLNLDVIRPVLEDKDSDTSNNNIGVEIFGEGNNIQVTGDPMKIYAKFMAFWMNYKQIAIVEYLAGFGSLDNMDMPELQADGTRFNKLKLSQWRPFTQNILVAAEKTRKKVLCRIRNYTLAEYIDSLSGSMKRNPHAEYDEKIYDFPVYNRYFFLGEDNKEKTDGEKIEESKLKTSENECHDHTYYVDEKGNGWTSEAIHTESSEVKHKHQIINYEVQSAQSHCYPNCEAKYGVKGAPPHAHKLLGEQAHTPARQPRITKESLDSVLLQSNIPRSIY